MKSISELDTGVVFCYGTFQVLYCSERKSKPPYRCFFRIVDGNKTVFESQHFLDSASMSNAETGNDGLHSAWKSTIRRLSEGDICDRILGLRTLSQTV